MRGYRLWRRCATPFAARRSSNDCVLTRPSYQQVDLQQLSHEQSARSQRRPPTQRLPRPRIRLYKLVSSMTLKMATPPKMSPTAHPPGELWLRSVHSRKRAL